MPLLWAGQKGPASYTRYFALGMHLFPALQSPFSFHLGCGYDARKKKCPKENFGIYRTFEIASAGFSGQVSVAKIIHISSIQEVLSLLFSLFLLLIAC